MAKKDELSVPLSDRPFCVGNSELAAYLVVDMETLRKNYLACGLHPVRRERKLYYFKKDIEAFLRKNDQEQVIPERVRKLLR
ncbi:MAG: hypothetical protein ACI30J_08165 [Paludibacteraceae bacterium]